jgi:Carbohydrate family 9 binding domain-like
MGSESFVSNESIVVARYVAPPLRSDNFDDPFWNLAEPIMIQRLWSGEPASSERQAEARLCWSDAGLHVRFRGNQHEPLVISSAPNTTKKTLGLWDRDVCEIFVAPDPDNVSIYYEFEAAPTGEWVDLAIAITPSGRETEWDYASGMEAAAAFENKRVTVGMTIPWSERIPKPAAGVLWKVNLFRCVGPEEPARYLAWRPTGAPEPAFHIPEAFGWLRFESEQESR